MALLAAAVAHTPEGEEVLRGARMRMARKPSAAARELLRNFPRSGAKRRRRRKPAEGANGSPEVEGPVEHEAVEAESDGAGDGEGQEG